MRASAAESAWLAVGAVAAFLAFVLVGVAVSLAVPSAFDTGIRSALVGALATSPVAPMLDVLNAIGGLTFGAILTIGVASLLTGMRRLGAAGAILSTWLPEGVSSIAKEILMRPRPPGAVVDTVLNESWSYPSGHVLRAMAVIGVLAWLATSRRPWPGRTAIALGSGTLGGFVMGIARVATGAHWPTDVLGGLLLGAAYLLAFAAVAVAAGALRRRSPAGEPPPPPSRGPGSGGP